MTGRSIFTTVELAHKRIKWWQRRSAIMVGIQGARARSVTAPPLIGPAASYQEEKVASVVGFGWKENQYMAVRGIALWYTRKSRYSSSWCQPYLGRGVKAGGGEVTVPDTPFPTLEDSSASRTMPLPNSRTEVLWERNVVR